MTDLTIEQKIQEKGLTAPRVTMQDIEDSIKSVHYFTATEGYLGSITPSENDTDKTDVVFIERPVALDLLTFCVIVLKNGFTVTGESACASPENFNRDIGNTLAYINAKNKIWPLLGYMLKDKLSKN